MTITNDITIDVPALEAWRIIGERFGDIGTWATVITESSLEGDVGEGAVRTCHIAGLGPIPPGVVVERLVAFDPEGLTFTYDAIQGLPSFFERATNRWTVTPLGTDRCRIGTRATIELRGVARLGSFPLRARLHQDSERVLEELKHHLEHGEVHPRKAASLTRAAVRPLPSKGSELLP